MVPGNLNPAKDEKFPMVFVTGAFKGLLLWADTSLAIESQGITAQHPQKLRIAELDESGKVLETKHVTVGRKDNADSTPDWPRLDSKFKSASKTAALIITREDDGSQPIAFCLY